MNIYINFIDNREELARKQQESVKKILVWMVNDQKADAWRVDEEDNILKFYNSQSACNFIFSTFIVNASSENGNYSYLSQNLLEIKQFCENEDSENRVLFVVDLCLDEDDSDQNTGVEYAEKLRGQFHAVQYKDVIFTTGHPEVFIERDDNKDLYRRAAFGDEMNNLMRTSVIAMDYSLLAPSKIDEQLYKVIEQLLRNGIINVQYVGEILFRAQKLIGEVKE